jgi:hypothetical protein
MSDYKQQLQNAHLMGKLRREALRERQLAKKRLKTENQRRAKQGLPPLEPQDNVEAPDPSVAHKRQCMSPEAQEALGEERVSMPEPPPLPPPPPPAPPPPLPAVSLEDSLSAICSRNFVMPASLREAWRTARNTVVIVQMTDTLGAGDALLRWIEAVGNNSIKGKIFDLANLTEPLPAFLRGCWVSQDPETQRPIVPVLISPTEERLDILVDIMGKIKPGQGCRVVLQVDDAYCDDQKNMQRLRRLQHARVCTVKPLGENVLGRCISIIAKHYNMHIPSAQHKTLLENCNHDPRWLMNTMHMIEIEQEYSAAQIVQRDVRSRSHVAEGTRILMQTKAAALVEFVADAETWVSIRQKVASNKANYRIKSASLGGDGKYKAAVYFKYEGVPDINKCEGVHVTATPFPTTIEPTTETFVVASYPTALRKLNPAKDTTLEELEAMAAVAADLSLRDVMGADFTTRDKVAPYTSGIMHTTVRTTSRALMGAQGLRKTQPYERQFAGPFFDHLSKVRGRNQLKKELVDAEERRAVVHKPAGRLRRVGAGPRPCADVVREYPIPPVDLFYRDITRDIWGVYIPLTQTPSIRDAVLYAAVALAENPPVEGQLKPKPDWDKTPPARLTARHLAEWFVGRCVYPHFTSTAAWKMAWSALVPYAHDQPLKVITTTIQQAMGEVGGIKPVEVTAVPRGWASHKFPKRLVGSWPTSDIKRAMFRVHCMAQQALALY